MLPAEHLPNGVRLEQRGVVKVPFVPIQHVNGVLPDEAEKPRPQKKIGTNQKKGQIALHPILTFLPCGSPILFFGQLQADGFGFGHSIYGITRSDSRTPTTSPPSSSRNARGVAPRIRAEAPVGIMRRLRTYHHR